MFLFFFEKSFFFIPQLTRSPLLSLSSAALLARSQALRVLHNESQRPP